MSVPSSAIRRWEPYAGIAYVALFVVSVVVSNPPADKASNRTWIADYTGRSEQLRHLATGLLLLLAGLALMTFLAALWRRIAAAHPAELPSRLPIAAAGTAAALMGAGGMVMGYIPGGEILGRYPLPSADLLRLSNDLGFALAGVGGSWAAAVAVATLSVQGHTAGVFGARMRAAGLITLHRAAVLDAVRPDRCAARLGPRRERHVDPATGRRQPGFHARTCGPAAPLRRVGGRGYARRMGAEGSP